jgi:hypothetical protein
LADLPEVKRKEVSYYVTPVATLSEKATFVSSAPLTDEEWALHRPDLPFAVAQRADLSWGDELDASAEVVPGDRLCAAQVYVIPFGPAGGSKAAIRMVADDGISFTATEILRKTQLVQRPFLHEESVVVGAGLYRYGLVRGVPAYYVWGAESRLRS